MKKLFHILILMIVLTGCRGDFSDLEEIEAVNLRTGANIVMDKDSNEGKNILKALKSREKVEGDTSPLTAYELILKKEGNNEVYRLYFDTENKAAYVHENDILYKIKDQDARQLFLSDIFSYIYVEASLYDTSLNINGENFKPDLEYDWTSKNIDGHFINNKGTLKGDKKNIVISQDGLEIIYEREPDNQRVQVYSQGNPVASAANIRDALSQIRNDGEYMLEVRIQWHHKEGSQVYGSQVLKFDALIDRPAEINIISKENYPGNILLLSVDNLNEDETLKLITDAVKTSNDIFIYKDKNYYLAPIDLYTQPGDYKVTAIVNESRENQYSVEEVFRVADKSFKTQYLTVSQEMNETNNDNAAIYEFAQLVKPARTVSAKEKLWEGAFIMPVEGELTTDFAEIRYVNNEPSSSRHSGLDLAAPTGTPVKAPNKGLVTFAMEGLLSPGSTVVIDHGMGLFTSYYHLNTIDVKKGDVVKKGDIIGSVGSTGFSTGPHLHYAVSIYNTYVNPYQTLGGLID